MTNTITVIRGDGIGPEIMDATLRVLDTMQLGLQYEFAEAGLAALEKHGEVLSCDLEFPVSTIPWMHRRIPVHLVKSFDGVVKPEDLRDTMNTRTGIISMSYVQFSNGFRSDLAALGEIKSSHALVVNASQAAGVRSCARTSSTVAGSQMSSASGTNG